MVVFEIILGRGFVAESPGTMSTSAVPSDVPKQFDWRLSRCVDTHLHTDLLISR